MTRGSLEAEWRALVAGERSGPWGSMARGGLALLSAMYAAGIGGYRAAFDLGLVHPARLPCPVVGVGNLTVGGTGKTTTVRWLVRLLCRWGMLPAILSRGYRGSESGSRRGPCVVAGPEGIRETVDLSGDEPQLLARTLPGVPVVVGSSRFANGLRACGEFGVDACVLDDGFQHRRLFRDLDLVLLDATNPFGNGRLLPSGSLREPATALRRAHAVILTNAGWAEPDSLSAVRATLPPGIVFARARHRPMAVRENSTSEPLALDTLQQGTWLPLSSLGRPESFERTLRDLGVSIAAPARFPDHHPYRSEDLARVMGRVRAERLAGVVTTEKDAVKIPADWLKEVPCRVLEVDLELVEGRGALEGLIHDRIVAAGAGTRPLEANKTDR